MDRHFRIAHWTSPFRALRRRRGWHPARVKLTDAKSILVIRPDEIGDVVLTVPFLRQLRYAAPNAHITLIVKKVCFELVEHSPYVDTVRGLNFTAGKGNRHRLLLVLAAWRMLFLREIRPQFDLVLLPRRGPDYYGSGLLGHVLAGRGALVEHREDATSISSSLAEFVYSNSAVEHEAHHNLHFLQWCGAPNIGAPLLELWLTDSDRRFAVEALTDHRKCVAFGTGAGTAARRWPVERFAAISAWFRASGKTPVLLGVSGDPEFSGGVNLIGKTSLRQAAAVLEHCSLFVGNDSGLMHIAASMRIPIVEISGFPKMGDPRHYNSPTRFSPIGVPHRIVQPSVCDRPLAIEAVTVDEVRIACSELMDYAAVNTDPSKPASSSSN